MADFRKSLLLAAMALAVGVGTASAQTGTCSGTAGAPPILRSQGTTELTGLITLECTGLPAGTQSINITEFLNSVTSRVGEPFVVVSPTGPTGATTGLGTVYTGTVTSNGVTFNGVTLPGSSAQVQIGGVRINATNTPTSGNGGVPVSAQLAISNSNLTLQTNVFVVGLVENAFGVAITAGASSVSPCTPTSTTVAPPAAMAAIVITEEFATAFKTQFPQSPTSPDSETGPYTTGPATDPYYPNTDMSLPAGSLATSGTQFAVTFGSIPSGLTYYIPVTISSNAGGQAILVTTAGGTTPVTAVTNPPAGLPYSVDGYYAITGGTVYYNVITTNPSVSPQTWEIDAYPNGTISGTPTATVSLAPNPGVTATDVPIFASTPLPATGTGLIGTTTLNPCQTSLLFPFVTNQAGFDTGISIAYTGSDPFGTSVSTTGGVAATCTLSFYGSPTTQASETLSIPTFGEGHTTISAVAAGFQGYMIAVCNFEYAHGFAFITDGFMGPGRGLSEGYLPLVIGPSRPGASTPLGVTGGPEALEN